MDASEVYSVWYNNGTGLELEPNVNHNPREYTSENGTLFYAEYLVLRQMVDTVDVIDILKTNRLLDLLEHSTKSGVYHRDYDSKQKELEGKSDINMVSHDNIYAVAMLAHLTNNSVVKNKLLHRCATSFGVFNNTKSFSTPFNPGFYAPFLALLGKQTLSYMFLPIFIINIIIGHFAPKSASSGRILNFIKLYLLRDKPIYGKLYKLYKSSLERKYESDNVMNSLMKIYFKNSGHPNIALSNLAKGRY